MYIFTKTKFLKTNVDNFTFFINNYKPFQLEELTNKLVYFSLSYNLLLYS